MLNKSYTLIAFVCVNFSLLAQSVTKTMKRMPDTGQTSSYTNTFGEDNDYSINAPYFIVHTDGIVTDTITGLMWQQTDGGEMTIENATTYCSTLTLAGYTDWRLPNAHESFSILNQQNVNPSLDNLVFPTSLAEYWWTSDKQANDNTKIWATNAGGGIGNHPKTETISAGGTKKFHVRAVRDVVTPIIIPTHFTNNTNVTVTDNLTGLVWQKYTRTDSLTWENALIYADTLTSGGFTDWRLPNIKELQSINDETMINPSINTSYFSNLNINKYWASTSLPNQTTKAWYLDTHYGITTYDVKTAKHPVICVRGNSASALAIQFYNIENSTVVYPNPFISSINVKNEYANNYYELLNLIGEIIWSGKKIGTQDFSNLEKGVYFLNIMNKDHVKIKLIKN
jgi:hypothetical protein